MIDKKVLAEAAFDKFVDHLKQKHQSRSGGGGAYQPSSLPRNLTHTKDIAERVLASSKYPDLPALRLLLKVFGLDVQYNVIHDSVFNWLKHIPKGIPLSPALRIKKGEDLTAEYLNGQMSSIAGVDQNGNSITVPICSTISTFVFCRTNIGQKVWLAKIAWYIGDDLPLKSHYVNGTLIGPVDIPDDPATRADALCKWLRDVLDKISRPSFFDNEIVPVLQMMAKNLQTGRSIWSY